MAAKGASSTNKPLLRLALMCFVVSSANSMPALSSPVEDIVEVDADVVAVAVVVG